MSTHWTTLTTRFLDEEQCLASYIAWQAAEVISNVKPANLINVLNRDLTCGRNMHTLWQKHRNTIFNAGEYREVALKQKCDRLLVLIYNPAALSKTLQTNDIRKTLRELGYRYNNTEEALAHLEARMQNDDFPHEIGFFLGYPVQDVLGFMKMNNLPLVGNGPWKMYGDLQKSLQTLEAHKVGRKSVLHKLQVGLNPLFLIQKMQPVLQQAA
jgi:hypothetical protein